MKVLILKLFKCTTHRKPSALGGFLLYTAFQILMRKTARLNKYLAEENRQYAKSVIVSNCIKKGYQAYRFVTEGENCEDCNSLDGKTFPLSETKIGENMTPMHPNFVKLLIISSTDKSGFFNSLREAGIIPASLWLCLAQTGMYDLLWKRHSKF